MSVRARPRTLVTALLAVALTLVAAIVTSQPAVRPRVGHRPAASRNYGCWERWGSNHLDPTMAQKDPMCWQAWQADPNAMWNWNGLYREGVGGNHQGVIPDGQLCSGGRTQAPRYNSLDAVGAWVAKGVPTTFTLTLTDSAKHGADYLRIYVTKAGFDPTTKAIGWGDLDLVKETGRYGTTGLYQTDVEPVRSQRPGGPVHDLAGQPPRPVVLPVQRHQHRWRHHHADPHPDADGDLHADADPDPDGDADPDAHPDGHPHPDADPDAHVTGGTGSCTATVKVVNAWNGSFVGEVTVKAGSTALTGWHATVVRRHADAGVERHPLGRQHHHQCRVEQLGPGRRHGDRRLHRQRDRQRPDRGLRLALTPAALTPARPPTRGRAGVRRAATGRMAAEPVATVERHATWKELFFDLVVVAGIGQLAHLLHEDTEPTTLGLYAVLYLAFWISWAGFAVYGNVAGDDAKTRVLITAMLGLAVMAASVPGIHGSRAAAFVIAYVALRWYAGAVVQRGRVLLDWPLAQYGLGALPWLVSLWVDAPLRYWLWGVGIVIDLAVLLLTSGERALQEAEERLERVKTSRRRGGPAAGLLTHRGEAHRGGAPRGAARAVRHHRARRGAHPDHRRRRRLRAVGPQPPPSSRSARSPCWRRCGPPACCTGPRASPSCTPHVVAPRIVMLLHALLTGSLAALAAALGVAVEHTHEPCRRSTARCCAGRWPPTARSAW